MVFFIEKNDCVLKLELMYTNRSSTEVKTSFHCFRTVDGILFNDIQSATITRVRQSTAGTMCKHCSLNTTGE